MRKALRSLAGALLPGTLLVAAAPAPAADQPAAVVRALLADDTAVATVGYRLATANVDLCVEHMVESGMLIETLAQYGSDYRAAAADILKLTERPTIALVVPGSPAERAELQPGDALIEADGAPFAETPPTIAGGTFTAVEAAMTALDSALADGTARLTVVRAGERRTIDVIGTPACKARFQLIPGDDPDAVANGTWVQLSTRMAGFAKTPDQLAAILGHELAHNALGHRKSRAAIQRAQELQADRLMPYLMARAGYDPAAAVGVWASFKRRHLGGLIQDATHPSWSERLRAVEAEVARIAELKARGEAIVPPADLRPR
ncbi:M48 family metallopeptidase [Sphingomonas sp.]|jgi:membrane-associated protease RseP (regulator of RpoE activity)|uniref:M48 family metallopeptidase n=1 Tax=Sphingomonas sp. TaxID=28214 RepID=UPI002E304C1E|nr:M48 family metallopeptidase [Sphingomonas sp.]HEX4695928.1 M48 family metallopeptidase [Sphingomonas sp.]